MVAANSLPSTLPEWIVDPAAVLFAALLLVLPLCWRHGSWVERACAVGLGVRLAIVVALLVTFGADHPVYPSRLLLTGLDLLTFSYFMGLVFAADRRFTLVMAAIALIGLMAQLIALFGFAPAALDLLTASRLGGLAMLLALLAGTSARLLRRRIAASKGLPDRTGSVSLP
jgi:hypothetical protein